jgi:hypothetical protein
MITMDLIERVSPIFLTVILITYLIIVELGNRRIRRALFPLIIVLTFAFLIMAVKSIYSTYVGLR